MTDIFVMLCCASIASGILLFFFMYNTYRGKNDTLSNSSIGSVYNFRYLQPVTGTYERYLVKVIAKRDMKDYIHRLNVMSDYRIFDKNFKRTNTLVTCMLPNGDIRNFYAERVQDCYRSLFGRLLYTTGIACMF